MSLAAAESLFVPHVDVDDDCQQARASGGSRIAPSLPEEILAKLSNPATVIHIGDVWWVPKEHHHYPGGKDRYCLIVGLRLALDGTLVSAHFLVGSRKSGSKPRVTVEPEEVGPAKVTHFSFWWVGEITPPELTEHGKWKGRLGKERQDELAVAIQESSRTDLKRMNR